MFTKYKLKRTLGSKLGGVFSNNNKEHFYRLKGTWL